jgi:DNA polymerase (family X)
VSRVFDVEKVLRARAKNDVAVEINAHPWRLDLIGALIRPRPISAALKGLAADRVLNAMTLAEIWRCLRQQRRSFSRAA